ncbi:hypothetical protein PO909_029477 [Leuciscus waleckii]
MAEALGKRPLPPPQPPAAGKKPRSESQIKSDIKKEQNPSKHWHCFPSLETTNGHERNEVRLRTCNISFGLVSKMLLVFR